MAKAVVCTFLATVFIILLVFSADTRHAAHKRLGLNRRLGYKASYFDPLVSRIERSVEEKGLRHHQVDHMEKHISSVPDVADANEYFDNEGNLNTTLRLMVLFPFLDHAPKDGVISANELGAWIRQQVLDRLNYRTEKVIKLHDQNGDGAISFDEYLPQFSKDDIDENRKGHGEAGWWMEQFKNADVDTNGTLDFKEFKERMDKDNDGKLNFEEFVEHAYSIYNSYAEFENPSALAITAEDKFAELDINKDKYLVVEELRPIFRYLKPGELFYAKYFTNYLVYKADDNKDGNLTFEEMLNHENIFYNSLYEDSLDEDDFVNIRDEL
ncbi:hypothetical protein PTKIN_Ptkin04bG0150800 [Pterospermum kingtungense]